MHWFLNVQYRSVEALDRLTRAEKRLILKNSYTIATIFSYKALGRLLGVPKSSQALPGDRLLEAAIRLMHALHLVNYGPKTVPEFGIFLHLHRVAKIKSHIILHVSNLYILTLVSKEMLDLDSKLGEHTDDSARASPADNHLFT